MEPFKKNQWSIPRTVSCLSNIRSLKNLNIASDLITHHKRFGNVFINLTGNTGLTLYASTSKRLRHRFIDAFKRKPKAVIGITKSHLMVHVIKILYKYRLVAVLIPFITLAIILSCLPNYMTWILFVSSAAYLLFKIMRLFKNKNQLKKKGVNYD